MSPHRGHLVGPLGPHRHTAAALTFSVVGFGAVLIEQKQDALGGVLEFLGPQPNRVTHQIHFDLRTGQRVDRGRDLVHRLAHDLHVFGVDHPARLRHCGARQHRIQWFTGQRTPRPQQGGPIKAPASLGRRDAPPIRQHLTPRLGAHLLGRGLGLQTGQHPVALDRQLTRQRFQIVEGDDQLGLGQRINRQRGQLIVRGPHRGYRRLHRVCTHSSNIRSNTKESLENFRRVL